MSYYDMNLIAVDCDFFILIGVRLRRHFVFFAVVGDHRRCSVPTYYQIQDQFSIDTSVHQFH